MAPGPESNGVASGNTVISAWASALLSAFLHCQLCLRRTLGQSHFERDHQQDDAAGDLQRRQRNAELIEDRLSEQGEDEHDQRGDGHGFERDRSPLFPGRIGCERGEQHRGIDGTDHREKSGEGGEEGFEHMTNEQAMVRSLA
jgi:hypothetical protein